MLVTVLKSFPYAHDGQHVVILSPGSHEVRDDLVPGLTNAGLLESPKAQKALPGFAVPPAEQAAPANKMMQAPSENRTATDTIPQRDRRKDRR